MLTDSGNQADRAHSGLYKDDVSYKIHLSFALRKFPHRQHLIIKVDPLTLHNSEFDLSHNKYSASMYMYK